MNILLIDPNSTSQSTIAQVLSNHKIHIASEANEAIEMAADISPDLIVLEMSLSGHSGMEFLYEFRTYIDWLKTPVIIYSSVRVADDVLESRSWKKLNIYRYLYKPDSSLASLKSAIEKALSRKSTEA